MATTTLTPVTDKLSINMLLLCFRVTISNWIFRLYTNAPKMHFYVVDDKAPSIRALYKKKQKRSRTNIYRIYTSQLIGLVADKRFT